MAEAVVIFAVERLAQLLISEAKFLYGVSNQIGEIQRELKRMQRFLKEADKKQIHDDRVRGWVVDMRDLAFRTEDVVETFVVEVALKKEKSKSGFKEMLRRFACIVSEGVSLHKIGEEINAIKGELNGLSLSLPTYGITKGLEEGESSHTNLKSRRTFYSRDVEKDFIGMEDEILQLISHLRAKDNGCEVISICGMGGQGKTTVATKIYNHANVKSHFKAFAWVCITQQFQRENVLKDILKELLPSNREGDISTMSDTKLVKELYKVQLEKNCLIVIDDIWTIDAWRSIMSVFPIGDTTSGSKILLTTRNGTVAQVGSVYKLPALTEDEGWQLLSKKAFSRINDVPEKRVTSEMERVGRNMVKRCKGLPLAVSTIGAILNGKTLRDWEIINKDISFYLARGEAILEDDEYFTVRQVLGLSYDSLPSRLRHCFLYLGKYREDEVIETEELCKLWVAEGMISMEDKAEGEMMLDVAERYLGELAQRNLVQVEMADEGKSWLKYQSCRVHDLIRDLCLSKLKEENFFYVIISSEQEPDLVLNHDFRARRVRRLGIHLVDKSDRPILTQVDISQIRSLWFSKYPDYSGSRIAWPEKILSLEKFKLLRILIFNGIKFSGGNLISIGELVYLKYMSFYGSGLQELPSSIGNLRYLEILDLRVSWLYVLKIPNVVWKLEHLKHLYLPDYINSGIDEKLRFDGLNELESLHNFNSRHCDADDLVGLRKIKVFSGKITDENSLIEKVIAFINLKELRHSNVTIEGGEEGGLTCLVLLLQCCFIDDLTIQTRIHLLQKKYDHNRFSSRLAHLMLDNCKFQEDPMILLEKLPNLRRLYMYNDVYVGREMVCSTMGFPQLQYLELYNNINIRNLRVDETAMQKLSYLHIQYCPNLEMLPDGLRFLSSLRDLHLRSMPDSLRNRVQVIDGVEGEDFDKIRHIQNVEIY